MCTHTKSYTFAPEIRYKVTKDCQDKEKEVSNFIELKGVKIDKAYIQIIETIKNVSDNNKLKHLIDTKKVKAYIVSKEKSKIPQGNDKDAEHCGIKLIYVQRQSK